MLMSDRDITDRIVLAMGRARAFEERVVATAAEFDLATVFDGLRALPRRPARLRGLGRSGAAAFDAGAPRRDARLVERGAAARFEPAAVLQELAEAGETFHGRG